MWKGKFSQGCAPQQLLEPVLGAINFDWVIAVLYSFLRHSVVLGATVLLRDPDFSFSCWTDGFTYGSRIIWYMEEFMVNHTCKTSPKSSPLHHRASEVVWGGVLVCQKDVVTEVLWFVQMQRKLKLFCCCCCSVCFGVFFAVSLRIAQLDFGVNLLGRLWDWLLQTSQLPKLLLL